MKYLSVFTLIIILSFTSLICPNELSADSPRMLLLESFTNVFDKECPKHDSLVKSIADMYPHCIIPVNLHFSSPDSTDPMYQANPDMNRERQADFYKLKYVPRFSLNGNTPRYTNQLDYLRSEIEYYAEQISVHDIEIHNTQKDDGGNVSVTVTTSAGLSGEMLRLYVVEREIHFDTAPGTNGTKDFYWVARDMLPNAEGTELNLAANESETFNFSYINNPLWKSDEIYVVAFIQDKTFFKSILQAASTIPTLNVVTAKSFLSVDSAGNTDAEITIINPNNLDVSVRLSIDTALYTNNNWDLAVSPGTDMIIGANSESKAIVTFSPNEDAVICTAIVNVETIVPDEKVRGTKILISAMSNSVKNIIFRTGSRYDYQAYTAFLQIPEFKEDVIYIQADAKHIDEIDPTLINNILLNYDYANPTTLSSNTKVANFIRSILEAGNNVIISAETALSESYNDEATPEAKFIFTDILGIVPNQEPVIRVEVNEHNQVTGGIPTKVTGISTDIVGKGLSFTINEVTSGSLPYSKYTDIIKIDDFANSEICLYYDKTKYKGAAAKAQYKRGKIFYMSFGFQALKEEEDRNTLMQRISEWFNMLPKEPLLSCKESVSFGEIEASKTVKKTFTVNNNGEYKLELIDMSVPEEYSDVFIIENFTKNTVIDPGNYKNIDVSFKPTEEGTYNTDLTIRSNMIDTITTIALLGSATPNSVDDYSLQDKELLTIKVGPNPFVNNTNLSVNLNSQNSRLFEITLISSTGRKVLSVFNGEINPGQNEMLLNVGNLASGTYFISAKTENFSTQIPIVIVK